MMWAVVIVVLIFLIIKYMRSTSNRVANRLKILNDKIEGALRKIIEHLRIPYVFEGFSEHEKEIILFDLNIFIHFICMKRIIQRQNIKEFSRVKFFHDIIIKNALKEMSNAININPDIEYEVMLQEYVVDDKIMELLGESEKTILCEKVIVVLMGHLGRKKLIGADDFRWVLQDWYEKEVLPIIDFYDNSIISEISDG